ncbi:MAG: hypothetical protein Q9195_008793 [Heterodermia aff. obscurata]
MDPTILNPTTRFARPDQLTSRSPSHSPARRQHFISHELDPLLANLSPSSTLEALQSTSVVSAEAGTHQRALLDSLAVVSTSDRAWGIKAALAGKKVREWYKELVAWPWPSASEGSGNGFEPFVDVRSEEDPAQDVSGDRDTGIDTRKKTEFWGHLPAHLVQECEDRIEAIRDDMETLEIEELKEHVRVSHHLPSRRSSVYDHHESNDATVHGHMDDFTAIVTATIMQTLPHLARLNSLLSTWSTRLLVLRQVPEFLDCLEKAQTALEAAWEVVRPLKMETLGNATGVNRDTFSTIRDILEKRVSELGRRLDCMLDALEGREDTLPDQWIDTMEALETDLGTWIVETENQVLNNEILLESSRNKLRKTAGGSETPPRPHVEAKDDHDSMPKPLSGVVSDMEMYENGRRDNAADPHRPLEHARTEDGVQDEDIIRSRESESQLGKVSYNSPSNSYQLQSDGIGELSSRLERVAVSQSPPLADLDTSQTSYFPKFSTEREHLEGSDHGSFEAYAPEATRKSADVDIGVVTRGQSASRPTPLILEQPRDSLTSNAASEFSSDISFPGSSTSDYFSDMSSPEIQQASRAEYFGAPIEVTTPSWSQREPISPIDTISRHSSQRTERGSRRSLSMDFLSGGITSPTSQRSRASTFIPESTIPENGGLADPWLTSENGSICHQRGRSASMQSLLLIPRNEVQNVTIKRGGSLSTASTIPPKYENISNANQTNLSDLQQSSLHSDHQNSTLEDTSLNNDEAPRPNFSPFTICETDNAQSTPLQQQPKILDNTSHSTESSSVPAKPRHRFETTTDLGAGSTPVKIRKRRKSDTSPYKTDSGVSSPTKNDTEQLEARISSILTQIPAHIRLTSGPEDDAPEVRPTTPDPRTPIPRSKTAPRLSRAQTTTPSPLPAMTLAPAYLKNARSRPNGGDPEIKLYHLHQSGKEAPIKLFVRLVGEGGERVMVRIGGGWADLGEYLKEYANHHGKRSVSDSRFAIQGLPSSPLTGSPAAANGSAPGSRPGSSDGLAVTQAAPHLKDFETPPGSVDTSRPGSAHSWKADESSLGGAGPKKKFVEVSPTKQAWVDGMMDQARNAAAEKKGDLGDLGKGSVVGYRYIDMDDCLRVPFSDDTHSIAKDKSIFDLEPET